MRSAGADRAGSSTAVGAEEAQLDDDDDFADCDGAADEEAESEFLPLPGEECAAGDLKSAAK
eukprot:4439934-Pleurochrysis_carterae.AAC.1